MSKPVMGVLVPASMLNTVLRGATRFLEFNNGDGYGDPKLECAIADLKRMVREERRRRKARKEQP